MKNYTLYTMPDGYQVYKDPDGRFFVLDSKSPQYVAMQAEVSAGEAAIASVAL